MAYEASASGGRLRRTQSIRLGFLKLLATLLALALISSAILIWSAYDVGSKQARRQLLDTTRALSRVIDGEFARHEAMLRTLAVSPSVAKEDWAAVDREARAVLSDRNAWIVVGDRFGQQLVNTRLPIGTRLPHGPDPVWIWPLLDRGRTHICDLTKGLIERRIICVDVPVMVGGKAKYYLSVIMPPRAMQPVFEQQKLPPDWYATMLDGRNVLVWRNHDPERYVGRSAKTEFLNAAGSNREGVIDVDSLDGVSTAAAYSKSRISGWTILVGAPRRQLDAAIWPALVGSVLTVLLLLVAGGFLTLRWMRLVAKGVEGLSAQAGALGRREAIDPSITRIQEFSEIAAALSAADVMLRRRDTELDQLNASLALRVETALADREAALAQLHEAQKLETLGQLTGGVAHDFNNLLTPIMGSLDMLARRVTADPKGMRLVEVALGSAERAKILIARLLSFARRQTLRPQAVDISALVTGMADFIRRSLGAAVSVDIDVGDQHAVAYVDPNQLELAILNLCVNARDALGEGGSVTVRVREEGISGRDLTGLSEGRYIRLSVIDTGVGMDEETRQRAIEPFFTTKEQGRGTGLGLSMVHGLAAQSGGAFMIASRLGEGTRVDLWLPPSERPVIEAVAIAPPAMAAVRGRILLVDDDAHVRAGTAEMLEELGYEVRQAESGFDALTLIGSGLAVDCVITDYLMPGMTGATLIQALRNDRPSLPIVLITGYAAPDLELPEPVRRLEKPFRQKHIAAVVAQAMAEPVGEGAAAAS